MAPGAGDDVIININASILFTGSTTVFEANSVTISGNAEVVFRVSTTKEIRLYSTQSLNPALRIDAGCSLSFRGSNLMGGNDSVLDLTYGTGVIGSIYGTLRMESSAPGATTGVRLLVSRTPVNPAFYAVLTVYDGGKIEITSTAGNTVSALVPVPNLIMKNGGVYENQKNGGLFPAGTWEPNSRAIEKGIPYLLLFPVTHMATWNGMP